MEEACDWREEKFIWNENKYDPAWAEEEFTYLQAERRPYKGNNFCFLVIV